MIVNNQSGRQDHGRCYRICTSVHLSYPSGPRCQRPGQKNSARLFGTDIAPSVCRKPLCTNWSLGTCAGGGGHARRSRNTAWSSGGSATKSRTPLISWRISSSCLRTPEYGLIPAAPGGHPRAGRRTSGGNRQEIRHDAPVQIGFDLNVDPPLAGAAGLCVRRRLAWTPRTVDRLPSNREIESARIWRLKR